MTNHNPRSLIPLGYQGITPPAVPFYFATYQFPNPSPQGVPLSALGSLPLRPILTTSFPRLNAPRSSRVQSPITIAFYPQRYYYPYGLQPYFPGFQNPAPRPIHPPFVPPTPANTPTASPRPLPPINTFIPSIQNNGTQRLSTMGYVPHYFGPQ